MTQSGLRVLVTGACGLVGKATVAQLRARGFHVTATDLDTPAGRKTISRLATQTRDLPGTLAVEWVDPSAKVSLVERSFSSSWAGTRVLEAESAGVRVVAVSRLGSAMLPTADLVVQDGDVVYLAVAHDAMTHLAQLTLNAPAGHGQH